MCRVKDYLWLMDRAQVAQGGCCMELSGQIHETRTSHMLRDMCCCRKELLQTTGENS